MEREREKMSVHTQFCMYTLHLQLIRFDSSSSSENLAKDEARSDKMAMTNISAHNNCTDTPSDSPKKSSILHPSEESAPDETKAVTKVQEHDMYSVTPL